jgi:hypothetical protein
MQRIHRRTPDRNHLPARRGESSLSRCRRHHETEAPRCNVERALQGNWRRLLAGVALLLLVGQPAFAATINVNARCTLARAIVAANSDTTAGGVCTRGRGPDRIVMPANGRLVLTRVHNTLHGPTGLPVIRSRITIVGNRSMILRAPPAPRFRIFAVARTGRLTLSRLTIRGGFAPRLGGGGIRSLGFLSLNNVVLDRNVSFSSSGGGLWAQNIVAINGSQFIRNQSFCPPPFGLALCNGGGGYYATGAIPIPGLAMVPQLTINGSMFVGNLAGARGGGLQINGDARINDSTLADNRAQQGGAMAVGTQLANIINDRLGAVSTQRSFAANMDAQTASVVVTDTTLTDNVAAVSGGGIIVGDESDLTLNNTVVSGNTAPRGREAVAQPGSFVDADNFNTIGYGDNPGVVGFEPGPTDTVAPQPPADPTPDALPPPPIEQPPGMTPPLPEPTPPTPPAPTPMPPDSGMPSPGPAPDDGPPDGEPPPDSGTAPDDGRPPNPGPFPGGGPPPDDNGPPRSPPDNGPPPANGPPSTGPPDDEPPDNGAPPDQNAPSPDDGPPRDNGPPLEDRPPSDDVSADNGTPPADNPQPSNEPPPGNGSPPDHGSSGGGLPPTNRPPPDEARGDDENGAEGNSGGDSGPADEDQPG